MRGSYRERERERESEREREPLCNVAKLNRISGLPKKLLKFVKVRWGQGVGSGGGGEGGLLQGMGSPTN